MSKNKNKGVERTTGKTFEEYKVPGEAAQTNWKESIIEDELDGYEAFDDEVNYKSPEEVSATAIEKIRREKRREMGRRTILAVLFEGK